MAAAAAAAAELCLTLSRDGPARWGKRRRGPAINLLGARARIERDIHKEVIIRKLTCEIDKNGEDGG